MADLEIKPSRAARLRVDAVAVIAVVILTLLIYLLAGGGENLFARRTTLTSFLPEATGLVSGSSGSEVRISGIRIGYVSSIRVTPNLDPQRAVEVQMRVLTRFLKNIPSDSQTDISKDTLIGYPFIDIALGKSPIPITENAVLESQPEKQQLIRADLVDTLRNELASIDQMLVEVSSPTTRTGKFVVGEELYDKLLGDVRGFDQTAHTLLTPQGSMGQAFYSLEGYTKARNLALQTDQSLIAIQNGEGAAGRLFASDEQYNSFLKQATDLRAQLADINAGKGKYGALLLEDTAYTRILNMLKSIDATITALNAGQGQSGRLLTSAQLYESLNGSLREMENFLKDFRENPQKYLRVRLRKKK